MAEREKHPWGKARPYKPGHVNWLAPRLHMPRPQGTEWSLTWPRICLLVIALALVGYGACGLLVDDLYLPAKRSRGTHYHGLGAVMMFCMLACAAAMLAANAFSRYDPATGRHTCQRRANVALALTVLFMIAGLYADSQA